MQACIIEAIRSHTGYVCLLVDEAHNLRPNADGSLIFVAKTPPRKGSCRLMLILLTDRLDWKKTLDPRVLSFLKRTSCLSHMTYWISLGILELRMEKALGKKKIELSVLKKVAALASRKTEDAGKAVEPLSN